MQRQNERQRTSSDKKAVLQGLWQELGDSVEDRQEIMNSTDLSEDFLNKLDEYTAKAEATKVHM